MPRSSADAPLRLLGGLSPERFLAEHWQKTPRLVRAAVDVPVPLPARDALFALARRDDVESRVVTAFDGAWTLAHGPFARLPRARRDWTLLVQGVNLVDAHADALMRRFDFVSAMRLDDLMMSYAADGGGVGPHLDAYDVFLLQVDGARRWRWGRRAATSARQRALRPGMPLKLLARFEPTDEAVLEPGDLLYLPPSCAHEGTAVGPCITASIGFRMPSRGALAQEFLFAMAEREWPDGVLADPRRASTATPAALDAQLLAAIGERVAALRFGPHDVEAFAGRHFSEPKPHVIFDRPPVAAPAAFAARAARRGLALDLRATMLYRGRRAWIAGDAFALPAQGAGLFRRFADVRRLDAADAARLVAYAPARALLHEWWQHGWIVHDGDSDGSR